jgi:branched-chain amino acid transport system ATP-binding protein
MLEVRNLNAFYGKSHILQGVSFEVGPGEIVSLIGRNGVGRSTTIKAIMGGVPAGGSATCPKTGTSFPGSPCART